MKKAVIITGGKQYLVSEGETIEIELLNTDKKKVEFKALLVIDGDKTQVGAPELTATVTADVLEDTRAEKVTSIRYKAKKRVKKVRGHRQHLSQIKIAKIS